ncbi:MAG: hypothetical protein AAF216_02185 [Pseudomonadota bacterium]
MLKPRLADLFLAIAMLCLVAAPEAHADIIDSARFKVDGVVVVWAADPNSGETIVADFIIDTGTGSTAATSGDIDLIADDLLTVVTGSLEPADENVANRQGSPLIIQRPLGTGNFNTDTNGDGVMDADDGFDAFQLRGNTDVNTRRMEIYSSFYVASSVPFRIDSLATPIGATTADQMNRMRAYLDQVTVSGDDGIAFGSAAQLPNSGGPTSGRRLNGRRFSQMLTPRNIFRGNQRTAASRGSLADQSVRFDMRYRYNSGNIDLADGAFEAEAEIIYTVYIP